ncbi:DegT/DnrJ/EryC1/StrS family aminotransferase [Nocardioides sp. CER19]|uniref:DegT/DnrJ/EryC1/StrS family aminotransferase n=1 Tax=Nocardioides sp. CER19 TaxID=3038538 RepID=UPI00244D4C28|nr:DegT/DnrJ/EryC1/StrS family aminotransferase [Nocardioides sp. CER19]MDH2416933.1 DegT/DnrJ/EryC1/StrS family aminotransferase [Nocardioides sp. CER19]
MTATAERAGVPFLDLAGLHESLEESLVAAVRRTIRANQLVRGPEGEAFEDEFAAYCGARHGVGVGNGLDALSLGLRALGVQPGDEVIVPGHTFVATWLAVSAVGATPIAADVDPSTAQLDPAAVEAAVGPRTAAVLAVHLYGAPAPMTALRRIADAHGLALVEDAAQAHGARLDGVRVGSLGDVAAFSFYPGKNLGALGDGGMVVTGRADVADRVRVLANYGARVKYDHEVRGVNSRLDEVQAAVLRVKLPLLDGWNAHRRHLSARYAARLADQPGIALLAVDPSAEPVHHLYPVRLTDRDAVAARLTERGIGVGIHYPVPPHRSPAYGDLTQVPSLPHSEAWAATELSLPIGPTMSDADVDLVADELLAAVG